VAKQKHNKSEEVSWGQFLRVVLTGEYNIPYCWQFSRTDAHSPQAIGPKSDKNFSSQLKQISANSLKSIQFINSLVRNLPQACKA